MMHSALLALLATVTLPAPPVPPALVAAPKDPVIKIWTDWEEYYRGQDATVHLRTRDDGYVIVMQADVDGRVRVLFPLDPGNDNFVRGGHDITLPGRGGKETFYVDGPAGNGVVYAAISSVPFRFNDFVQGDHWDYGALYDKTLDNDFENGFTTLVNRMSGGHFDYDVYRYKVIAQSSYAEGDGGGGYGGPVIYAGSPCWSTPWSPAGCYGPSYVPGPYLGVAGPWWPGYGYGGFYAGYGWGFGLSFGFGWGSPYYYGACCGYYGYGAGYPYYGYGYGGGYGYGYPYYRPPYYGYTTKPGGTVGVTGVGYRPRTPTTIAGGTPYRTPGGRTIPTIGTPYRTPTGKDHPDRGERTGYTLGRSGGRNAPNVDPRRGDGYSGGRRGTAVQPYGRGGRGEAPPRYTPGAGTEPRGRGGYAAPSGGAPSGRAPSAPPGRAPSGPSGRAPSAPSGPSARPPSGHYGGGAPASHPAPAPSHSGGGGGHRAP